jgi:outer membrane receptor protein involved in Fe transport
LGASYTTPVCDSSSVHNLSGVTDDFKKEVSKSAELGFKAILANRSWSVNGAVFQTKVENMQIFNFFVGPFGLLQPMADGLKLVLKETIVPSSARPSVVSIARATFSARSIWRFIQKTLSATRESMRRSRGMGWGDGNGGTQKESARWSGSGRAVASGALDHPGVLAAAPLRRIDDERSLHERDARQPAREDEDLLAVKDEGPEIDMPPLE